ncbi:MAG: HDOD domain-containing protein [Sideroxyarcus sp.]
MTQHMDKAAIFDTLASQAAQGELVFSTGAQVALKLRHALDDPDCHINTASRLIQAEPLLAARVIAIANSVVYNRSGREITDVQVALSLLGFKTIRSLAMALVTRQMAGKSKNSVQQELVNKLWEHSAHVASLAHAIARHVTHQDPEAALFAGIIHEIGGFYMLSRAEEFPGLMEGDFDEWVEGGEIKVGRSVIGKLQVPASVTAVMETYWDGFLSIPPATLADTLLLAEELSPVPSPLHKVDSKNTDSSMKANIEMEIGEETLTRILAESAEEIGSLTKALQF